MPEARYLLDTNICIYLLEGRSDAAAARIAGQTHGCVVTSSIAYAEVLTGMIRLGAREKAELFFDEVPVLPFDRRAADVYAELPFKRADYDRLIAAHALSRGLVLVTNNPADFAWVEGLTIENWTLPL